MLPDPPPPADPTKQYSPEYYFVEQPGEPAKGDYLMIDGKYYSILPDPTTIYYLFNSIKWFYENGGGDAYIISVGGYGAVGKKPMPEEGHIINPNVALNDLLNGLALLKNEEEPTMYICPEATLLATENNGTLMRSMLLQAEEMQTALCILDIIGGRNPDPTTYTDDIQTFRDSTGSQGLSYGTCYYPFVGTTIMQNSDIDFTNLFGGDIKKLAALINPTDRPNPSVAEILAMIENPPANPLTISQYQSALENASPSYLQMIKHVLSDANLLPPSGAMAGVYTFNDNGAGVWNSPANVSLVGAASLPIEIDSSQQSDLNIDTVSGKSVNALRYFNGQGVLVWGARTLDGNSLDWRYLSVRRTIIYFEQSIKLAIKAYELAPNDANTWNAVKSMISNFLNSVWKQGGLLGATVAHAYQVDVGLGITMTAEDIHQGFMIVAVKVAVVHPAEFIVLTFQQEMAKSG